jgi:hypothetical protein
MPAIIDKRLDMGASDERIARCYSRTNFAP